jgi:hypothetical protein
MIRWLTLALHLAVAGLKSRRSLLLEILALRHQLLVLSRKSKSPRLTPLDRVLWAWLSQAWGGWKSRLCLVQPSTVLQWHRAGFRLFWRWKSCARNSGRKTIAPDTLHLIGQMSRANPLWGAQGNDLPGPFLVADIYVYTYTSAMKHSDCAQLLHRIAQIQHMERRKGPECGLGG